MLRKEVMKVNIGETFVKQYSQDELLGWLADSLTALDDALVQALGSNNLGVIGVCVARLNECALVAKALDEQVNGKKEKVVL